MSPCKSTTTPKPSQKQPISLKGALKKLDRFLSTPSGENAVLVIATIVEIVVGEDKK